MSLGVLNNLSAVYAENALNNTNNSLNTTLQQLSSGSQINSGADDAAGLSLVDGLSANQAALTQSETNASEGVGLLQVADGALSQVTSLLNRAVTLATEASNGTLDSTQDAAANQEYQSILSEISNIGSTTTYNQQAVFNSNTDIYTGDSSTKGASIDDLDITALSSSNMGNATGSISYTSGTNDFINLSSSTQNAALTDSIGSAGAAAASTIDITYAVGENAAGDAITSTATISTGGSTGYANTVQGMIQAINNSGLGITASFATLGTADPSASSSTASETGIMISGDVTTSTPTAVGQVEIANSATTTSLGDINTAVDYTTGSSGTAAPTFTNYNNGTATIGYTSTAGENLSSTNLLTQSGAESALTDLNSAISDVAAQDGYIGAEINTLNAVSSVESTQQENIESAQNAVQATDYASATSNMSKYEILSQTGIAALAQANSQQQDVLKLLQ